MAAKGFQALPDIFLRMFLWSYYQDFLVKRFGPYQSCRMFVEWCHVGYVSNMLNVFVKYF